MTLGLPLWPVLITTLRDKPSTHEPSGDKPQPNHSSLYNPVINLELEFALGRPLTHSAWSSGIPSERTQVGHL